MTFKIPKSFQLGGQVIKVRTVDKMPDGNPTIDGLACYSEQEVLLNKRNQGEYAEYVFFHELVHHIYNQMGDDSSRSDEKNVSQFATFLHQAIKSMRG